jgi:hypothetical protein
MFSSHVFRIGRTGKQEAYQDDEDGEDQQDEAFQNGQDEQITQDGQDEQIWQDGQNKAQQDGQDVQNEKRQLT